LELQPLPLNASTTVPAEFQKPIMPAHFDRTTISWSTTSKNPVGNRRKTPRQHGRGRVQAHRPCAKAGESDGGEVGITLGVKTVMNSSDWKTRIDRLEEYLNKDRQKPLVYLSET
jgi:hypothetical protein